MEDFSRRPDELPEGQPLIRKRLIADIVGQPGGGRECDGLVYSGTYSGGGEAEREGERL